MCVSSFAVFGLNHSHIVDTLKTRYIGFAVAFNTCLSLMG